MVPQHVARHFSCGQLFASFPPQDIKAPRDGYNFAQFCPILATGYPQVTTTSYKRPKRRLDARGRMDRSRSIRCQRASKSPSCWASWPSQRHVHVKPTTQPLKNLSLSTQRQSALSRPSQANTNKTPPGQASAPVPTSRHHPNRRVV